MNFWDFFRFLDFLTIFDHFLIFLIFKDFWIFFGFFVFFWIFWIFLDFLDVFWILGFFEIFWNFWDFFFLLLLLMLLLNVTMVTTGQPKLPKMGQNRIKSSFFARKKASAEGRSPPQELEVGPRSGPYLLVHFYIMNTSSYHTIRFRKKSNFTSEPIQFQIRTNHISHWNKFHFTFIEISSHNGTNPISNLKKLPISRFQKSNRSNKKSGEAL